MQKLIRRAMAGAATYVAAAALMSTMALAQGQPVVTRLVVPSGTATSTKILPGQPVTFEVRIDAPDKQTVGTAYRLGQTSPPITPGNFFFQITGRSIAGSPYNDASSGSSDATVTASPGNRLDPENDVNLGKNTVGLASNPAPAGSNILATTITLASDAATPLGTYRVQPAAGSFVTEITTNPGLGTDWDMSGAFFDIIVGATLTVTKSGAGTGTVLANSGAINCGATCSDIYPGTTVTLTAQPSAGSTFTGWSGGGCTGTGNCVVAVTAATTVNAAFGLTAAISPTLNKAFSPTSFNLNGTSVLTFTITNGTPANPLQVVSFTDTLPSGLQVAATPGVVNSCSGGTITAAAGSSTITVAGTTVAAAPASCTIAVNVTNKQGQANASCANNPAAFTNAGATNTTGVNNISGLVNLTDAVTQSCVTVQALRPTLNKAFAPASIAAGGTTTLTFTVTNPAGFNPAQTVGFTDTLPSGLQIAAAPNLQFTCTGVVGTAVPGGNSIAVTAATVPASTAAASTCTMSIDVTNVAGQTNASCASNPAAFTNAGATNTTGVNNISALNNLNDAVTQSCVTVVAPQPSVNKAFSPTTISVGGSTTLTFTVTNPAGNGAVSNVGFVDTLPSGLAVAAVPGVGGTCANAAAATTATAGSGTITVANLQVSAGASSCTVTVNVTNAAGQSNPSCPAAAFTNAAANVTVSNAINGVASSCVVVTALTPSLTKVFSPGTFLIGGTSTLTFTITNPATNNPAQTFSFTDTLPSGLRVAATPGLASTCTGGTITAAAGSGSVAVSGTSVGASTGSATTCTISVNVTNVPGQGNTSCEGNPAAFTNSATNLSGVTNLSTTSVVPSCVTVTGLSFAITKTPSSGSLQTNSPLTFTIGVTNNGPDSGNGALLTDPVIAGFTATGVTCASATGGAACPAVGNVTLANLQGAGIALTTFPANSSITFQLAGTFTAQSGTITNTATVTTPAGVPLQTQSATGVVAVQAPPPTNIPTLSEWMLALLALMLGGVALRSYRRRF